MSLLTWSCFSSISLGWLVDEFGEVDLKLFVGVIEAGANGSFGDIQDFADFCVSESLDIKHGYYCSVIV